MSSQNTPTNMSGLSSNSGKSPYTGMNNMNSMGGMGQQQRYTSPNPHQGGMYSSNAPRPAGMPQSFDPFASLNKDMNGMRPNSNPNNRRNF
jgi:hypothetical protein